MSTYTLKRPALMLAFTVIASTGCGGSGASAPVGVLAPVTASGFATTATTLNVSGQYAGKVQDTVFGAGEIYADFSQYKGVVGGVVQFVYGSTEFFVPATFLMTGGTLTGSGAIGRVTGGICMASETATYSSHNLNGSYKATHGCSGDSGTFMMTQRCRFPQGWGTGINSALKRC